MKILILFVLIIFSVISINLTNAYASEITVKIATGSSTPGCELSNSCYSPHSVTINLGDTVKWENVDTAAHTVTRGNPDAGPSGIFDSSLIFGKASFTHTFDKIGTHDYFCMIHPWMVGNVIVKQTSSTKIIQKIPDWVRNNAKWWSDGSIDDETFVSGMKHLIKENIIKVSHTTSTSSTKEIPNWIKNNAKWWSEKTIDDESFISSMQFLISNGIINISENNCSGNARCISGTVTEVIDGDTIKVDGKSIRFALASAPELDEFNGPKARSLIESICGVGSKVLVDEDDKQTQGSYGRIIGLILCNEKILNEELVKSGIGTISKEFCNSSEFSMLSWAQNYGCAPAKTPIISKPEVTSSPKSNCDPSYPTVCIAPYPPDLNCKDVPYKKFKVLQPDPHGFDRDRDGIGCES